MQWNVLKSETWPADSQYSAPRASKLAQIFSGQAPHTAEAASTSTLCQVMPSAQPGTRERTSAYSRWSSARCLPKLAGNIPANQLATEWRTADYVGCQHGPQDGPNLSLNLLSRASHRTHKWDRCKRTMEDEKKESVCVLVG